MIIFFMDGSDALDTTFLLSSSTSPVRSILWITSPKTPFLFLCEHFLTHHTQKTRRLYMLMLSRAPKSEIHITNPSDVQAR